GAGSLETEPVRASERRISRLARTLPLSWLMLIARDLELAAALAFEPNVALLARPDAHKIGVLTTGYPVEGSFAGRNERIATRKFDPSRMPALSAFLANARRVSYSELTAIVAALNISRVPHEGVVRLLDAQLVRPVAPYSQRESRPLAQLASALSALGSRRASRIAALMRGVQNMTDACTRLGGRARLEQVGKIRRTATSVFQALGADAPPWLGQIGFVYEDVCFGGASIELPASVRHDLDCVARELRPRMIRGHLYDAIYSHFVRSFGPAGETADILGFLQSF